MKPDRCSNLLASDSLSSDESFSNSLGLKRDLVYLVPHNPRWKIEFGITKWHFIRIMGDDLLAVYHIGSTAIPSLSAKPILDIAVVIGGFETLMVYVKPLMVQGYEHRPLHDNPDRWLFIKGTRTIRTHHIHVFRYDSPDLADHLFFRDYLITHPAAAARYNKLKMNLASRYAEDRARYTHEKESFIGEILALNSEIIQHRESLPQSHTKSCCPEISTTK